MFYTIFTRAASALILALLPLCVTPSHASEFRYNETARSIEMKGTIRVGDEVAFSSLLRSYPGTQSVTLLGSVGGEYTSALEISLEIKRYGLKTVSSHYCHSACAYIWLAGASREVTSAAYPKIHLPYLNSTGQALPKLAYAWIKALGLPRALADAVVDGIGPDNAFVKLTPAFLAKSGALDA